MAFVEKLPLKQSQGPKRYVESLPVANQPFSPDPNAGKKRPPHVEDRIRNIFRATGSFASSLGSLIAAPGETIDFFGDEDGQELMRQSGRAILESYDKWEAPLGKFAPPSINPLAHLITPFFTTLGSLDKIGGIIAESNKYKTSEKVAKNGAFKLSGAFSNTSGTTPVSAEGGVQPLAGGKLTEKLAEPFVSFGSGFLADQNKIFYDKNSEEYKKFDKDLLFATGFILSTAPGAGQIDDFYRAGKAAVTKGRAFLQGADKAIDITEKVAKAGAFRNISQITRNIIAEEGSKLADVNPSIYPKLVEEADKYETPGEFVKAMKGLLKDEKLRSEFNIPKGALTTQDELVEFAGGTIGKKLEKELDEIMVGLDELTAQEGDTLPGSRIPIVGDSEALQGNLSVKSDYFPGYVPGLKSSKELPVKLEELFNFKTDDQIYKKEEILGRVKERFQRSVGDDVYKYLEDAAKSGDQSKLDAIQPFISEEEARFLNNVTAEFAKTDGSIGAMRKILTGEKGAAAAAKEAKVIARTFNLADDKQLYAIMKESVEEAGGFKPASGGVVKMVDEPIQALTRYTSQDWRLKRDEFLEKYPDVLRKNPADMEWIEAEKVFVQGKLSQSTEFGAALKEFENVQKKFDIGDKEWGKAALRVDRLDKEADREIGELLTDAKKGEVGAINKLNEYGGIKGSNTVKMVEPPAGGGKPPKVPDLPPPSVPPSTPGAPNPFFNPKYAKMNLNLQQMETTDDVRKTIVAWSDDPANAKILEKAYEEGRTEALAKNQATKDALEIGMSEAEVDEIIKGSNYDLSQVADRNKLIRDFKFMRSQLVNHYTRVNEIMLQVGDTTIDDGTRKLLQAELVDLNTQTMALRLELQGRSQLAGKLLQAHRSFVQAGTAGEKIIAMEKFLGKNMNIKGDQLEKMLEGMTKLNYSDPIMVGNFLKEAMIMGDGSDKLLSKPTANLLVELFYNSILSSVTSHEANLVGNTMSAFTETVLVRSGAITLEHAKALFSGKETSATYKEMVAGWGGMNRSMRTSIMRSMEILKTGFDPEEIINPTKWGNMRFEAWSIHHNPVVRRLAPVVEISTRMLKASDVFFKGLLYDFESTSLAYRKAMEEGLVGKEAISKRVAEIVTDLKSHPDILKKADEFAAFGTFNVKPHSQSYTWLEKTADRAAEWVAGMNRVNPFLRIVAAPFVNIANNLFKRAFVDFSPVGFAKARHLNGFERSLAQTRAILGTGLMGFGATAYLSGNISLDTSDNQAQRDWDMGVKHKPPGSMAFTLGGKRYWVPIRRLEPYSQPVMIGARLAKTATELMGMSDNPEEVESFATEVLTMGAEMGRGILESTYFDSIQNLFDVFGRGYSVQKTVSRTAANMTLGFMPFSGLMRNAAQFIDPYVRKPDTYEEFIRNNLPGLSRSLPLDINLFGEGNVRFGGRAGALSFIRPTEEQVDLVSHEIERVGYIPEEPSQDKRMDDLEYEAYQIVAGSKAHQVLTYVFMTPEYRALPDGHKEDVIKNVVQESRKYATELVLQKLTLQKAVEKDLHKQGYTTKQAKELAPSVMDAMQAGTYFDNNKAPN